MSRLVDDAIGSRSRGRAYGILKDVGFMRTVPRQLHSAFEQRKRHTVPKMLTTRSTGRRRIRFAHAPHRGQSTGARSQNSPLTADTRSIMLKRPFPVDTRGCIE